MWLWSTLVFHTSANIIEETKREGEYGLEYGTQASVRTIILN